MSVTSLILLVLIVLLILSIPGMGIRHDWGYMPSGVITVIVVLLLVLLLTGRL